MTERYPTESEVNQVEPEVIPPAEVPVRIEGPVEVRALPAVAWFATRYEISDTTGPIKASSRNPYRKRLLLHSETSGFYYGSSQSQVQGRSTAPFIVQDVVIELTHTEEVWINNIGAQAPVVSIIEEMWTN
jgi:hypothetical protein